MQLIGSLPALEARVHPFKGVRASHEALHSLDARALERSTSTLPGVGGFGGIGRRGTSCRKRTKDYIC